MDAFNFHTFYPDNHKVRVRDENVYTILSKEFRAQTAQTVSYAQILPVGTVSCLGPKLATWHSFIVDAKNNKIRKKATFSITYKA